MNFVRYHNCGDGWRIYFAPTWGRHKDMQALRDAAAAYIQSGELPKREHLHLINYRYLTFDETLYLRNFRADLGVVQFEYILYAQRQINKWSDRSESAEKLAWMWKIELYRHFMEPIGMPTTWDLHLAKLQLSDKQT